MLTIAQTLTRRSKTMVNVVLLLIACLVLVPVWVIALAVRLRARVLPVTVGGMSEQWLVAYRASHSD